MQSINFLTGHQTRSKAGLSRSRHYQRIADGLFPPQVKLGKTSLTAEHEVDAVNRAVLAGATEDELRELVKSLVAARKQDKAEVQS